MKLTIKNEIINDSGMIRFHEGQVVDVERIEKSQPYYGKSSGTYYPEIITGIKLLNESGIWPPQCFKEL